MLLPVEMNLGYRLLFARLPMSKESMPKPKPMSLLLKQIARCLLRKPKLAVQGGTDLSELDFDDEYSNVGVEEQENDWFYLFSWGETCSNASNKSSRVIIKSQIFRGFLSSSICIDITSTVINSPPCKTDEFSWNFRQRPETWHSTVSGPNVFFFFEKMKLGTFWCYHSLYQLPYILDFNYTAQRLQNNQKEGDE